MLQKVTEPEKIFVELDDEITFIAEKVRNAISERVVLIIPDAAMLLSSLISVKILWKELISTDKASVFIVKDEHGFSMIKKLELEVVKNANEITEDMWQTARYKIDEALRLQSKKKSELLEKRNLQKTEEVEKETQRVDKIIDQVKREGTNEITVTKVKEDVATEKQEIQINYDLYKKTRRLPAKLHKVGERVFASGGDISEFEEAKDNIKLDNIGNAALISEASIESVNNIASKEMGDGNLLNINFNKHSNDFVGRNDSDSLSSKSNILDRATKRKIDTEGSNIFKKSYLFLKNFFDDVIQKIENFTVNRKKIFLIIPILLLIIAFIILSITVFPSATIRLSETSTEFTSTENVTANLTTQTPDSALLTLPIEVLIVDVNGSQSINTTQDKEIGTSSATGQVTFYNKSDNPIDVPANTALTIKVGSASLTYLTSQAVTVNKKTSSIGGETWGSKDVSVVAQNPGTAYNIANQGTATFTIAGFTSASIIATMYPTGSFTGGASKKTKVVAQADIDSLKKQLTDSLKAQAKAEASSNFSDTYLLLSQDVDFQVVSDKLSATLGQEATTLSYDLVAKGSIKGISKANIDLLVKGYLDNKLKDFGNFEIKTSNSKYDLTKFDSKANTAVIALSMNATYYINTDEAKLKDSLKSKSLSDATNILSNLDKNTSITKIDLFPQYLPNFLRKFPSEPNKIEISIEKK